MINLNYGHFFIIGLLLFSTGCGWLDDLFGIKESAPSHYVPSPYYPSENTTAQAPVNCNPAWEQINQPQVEKSCLQQSKNYAVESGYSA